jgi:uncharacterized protein HemX
MKLTHLALIAGVALGAWTQVQAQESGREDRAVARACKADAQKMCAGKTGQEMQQCLKTNQAKLSSNCKDAVSKLPNPPKS